MVGGDAAGGSKFGCECVCEREKRGGVECVERERMRLSEGAQGRSDCVRADYETIRAHKQT